MTVSWVLLINLGNVNNDMNVLLSIRKKRQRSSGSGGERERAKEILLIYLQK